jgi:hypothetical protein
MLRVYERPPGQLGAQHTVAGFLVDDLHEELSELRRRGVSFEEYDLYMGLLSRCARSERRRRR